ncbi:conserved hypothetical protein [Culex quinquefasciatus]|uniref:Uncharacterized protein n=1 Tax=Culex quinquefasciatus TaxID=7176 RepID=B0WU13_CULQU|nr:conserved hypothetical protein [Culex quinquefasciatus]|eukprot:XP_001857318.1 conserved hypothetical protein [Culex quinquefasciatus]
MHHECELPPKTKPAKMMIGSEGALVKKNYHTPFSPSWESYRWENTCGLLAEIFFLIFTPEVAGNGKVATTLELPLQAGIAILTLQLFAEAVAKKSSRPRFGSEPASTSSPSSSLEDVFQDEDFGDELSLLRVQLLACSTVTVTKCQAALRTLQAFPFFRPTCLCKEPGIDPDCNYFRDFLFDHPCGFVSKKVPTTSVFLFIYKDFAALGS